MANEATISSSLAIIKGNINYRTNPTSFRADVSGEIGPTPGAFSVSVAGTDCDLSELTTVGWARFMNLDSTNFVDWGIWDGATFYPLGRLLAGEPAGPLRLSPLLSQEFGTGTGTTGASVNTLRFKADTAACVVVVEAFEA